ncbi:class I SAM-dependent methyltransferase [Flavobacterium sp.]|uniref:class I SAM-dependent methyltransferase n=1 Tax=Flavobacterium sp. TaxID=239 RepID=UPI0033412069
MENKEIICKICNNSIKSLRFQRVRDINFKMTTRLYDWFSCENCGILQITANDDFKEDLSEYYKKYDPHSHGVKLVSRFSISPISLIQKKLKLSMNSSENFSVLDVGCGDGNLLFNIRSSFPNSVLSGIDFNIESAKYNLRNCDVTLWELSLIDFSQSEKFDFICCSQLLEHLDDPSDLFNLIKRNLNKDGLACIDIPNINSRSFKIFGSNWIHLDTPRHRILFSPKSLKSILIKNGFDVLEIKTFGTGFAYLSSFLNFLNVRFGFNLKLPFKIKWVLSKIIQIIIKSDDKIFVSFKLK